MTQLSQENAASATGRAGLAGLLMTLGIVFGDIGTSPLYVMKAITHTGETLTDDYVLGALSCIIWTLTLQTTVKYVLLALRADNRGEGGILALYALLRRHRRRWIYAIAIIGASTLLADGVITPAITVTTAIEGLRGISPDLPVLPVALAVITVVFFVQRFGTQSVGRSFGAFMLVWFLMLGALGVVWLAGCPAVLKAFSPHYAVMLLVRSPGWFLILGAVFLCTTGAEALYSDMGHVGRGNIYFTWPFIKIALVLCYFGQGAWMLNHWDDTAYNHMHGLNPFFEMMTPSVRYVAVLLSVCAGVIASQALITGAYTMVSEATRLNWMPHLQVRYPARTRGQLYIPVVNAVLCVSTLLVLAMFRDSEHISAAYGLALTVTMITTTILLAVYIWHDGKRVGAVVFTVVFLAIQFLFFFASMAKFLHGGWFTMLLTLAILLIMYTWNEGTKLERAQRRHMQPADCVPVLKQLHEDDSIPYFTDNIVYLTSDPEMKRVDTDIFFSIFADHPKRARAWWAVSVETSDNPFTREYSVENFGTDFLFRVRIRLGFKVSQSIPAYIHQIMNDLSKSGDLPKQTTRYPKLDADPNIGPIRYVLIHKALMPESKVSQKGAISLQIKYAIRHLAGSPVKWFGLAPYNPLIEIQPLFLATERPPRLKRV